MTLSYERSAVAENGQMIGLFTSFPSVFTILLEKLQCLLITLSNEGKHCGRLLCQVCGGCCHVLP